MKTKKENLLIIAGVVWALAGINILRIGAQSYAESITNIAVPITFLMFLGSALICFGFMMMFRRVVKRNTKRILSYPKRMTVFAFLDLKGYLLMLFMMGLGITLRGLDLLPTEFFAVFYTGLGMALTSAGGVFIISRVKVKKNENETA